MGSSVFTVSAPVDFGTAIDNRIDHCVSVNDSYAGLLAEQICVNKVDKTVTYTREIGPYAQCGEYTVPNTALGHHTAHGHAGRGQLQRQGQRPVPSPVRAR